MPAPFAWLYSFGQIIAQFINHLSLTFSLILPCQAFCAAVRAIIRVFGIQLLAVRALKIQAISVPAGFIVFVRHRESVDYVEAMAVCIATASVYGHIIRQAQELKP